MNEIGQKLINAFKCQCCPHIETSQLICCANQLTGFYMRATLAFNGLMSCLHKSGKRFYMLFNGKLCRYIFNRNDRQKTAGLGKTISRKKAGAASSGSKEK